MSKLTLRTIFHDFDDDGAPVTVVNFNRDDGSGVQFECKRTDLRSYTALQGALLRCGGMLWRCDRIEHAETGDRRTEFLNVLEEALEGGRLTT